MNKELYNDMLNDMDTPWGETDAGYYVVRDEISKSVQVRHYNDENKHKSLSILGVDGDILQLSDDEILEYYKKLVGTEPVSQIDECYEICDRWSVEMLELAELVIEARDNYDIDPFITYQVLYNISKRLRANVRIEQLIVMISILLNKNVADDKNETVRFISDGIIEAFSI